MAQDARQIRVAVGGGDVAFAPVGSTLPEDVTTALDPAFVIGGYTTEEGATYSYTPEVTEIRSWQSKTATRILLTGADISVRCSLQQQNAANLQFAFGGGRVETVRSGLYKYTFPADDAALQENALVLVWKDGPYDFRLVLPRGAVSEGVESQVNRTDASLLPITFRALGGTGNTPFLLTNDPAYEVGS